MMKIRLGIVLFIGLLAVFATNASAAYRQTTADGNYTNTATWYNGLLPNATADAGDVLHVVTLDSAYTTFRTYIGSTLTVGSGGVFTGADFIYVGCLSNRDGSLIIDGGSVVENLGIYVGGKGAYVNNTGTLTIKNGGSLYDNGIYGISLGAGTVADTGVGTMNLLSGADVNVDRMYIGAGDLNPAYVNLHGGQLTIRRDADWVFTAGTKAVINITDGSLKWTGSHSSILLTQKADGRLTFGGTTTNMLFETYTSESISATGTNALYIYEDGANTYAWSTAYNANPVISSDNSLPFSETFDALDNGALNTQNNWGVQGETATVQTTVVQSGKAVELTAATASHELSNSNPTLWMSFWARCEEAPDTIPELTNADTSLAFYISTNRNLVVTSNSTPVMLSTVIPTNVWTRFDVFCNYDDLTWNLSVNQTNVAAGLPLYSNNRMLASVQIENPATSAVFIDNLSIADQEPVTDIVDSDGDTLPDWWEQEYFGGVTNAAPTVTNRNAYIAGLGPSERFEISHFPLSWNGQCGRRYSVYASTNLTSGFTFQTNILWSDAQYVDLVNTNEPAMFYRVDVELDTP